MIREPKPSSALWLEHVLQKIEVVEMPLRDCSSSLSNRQLHRSWVNANDDRFYDSRRGFGSGSGENRNDGCVLGFGIFVEAIEISPATTNQLSDKGQEQAVIDWAGYGNTGSARISSNV